MRLLKIILFLLLVLVLQTVVFTRLNFFGVFPDLILVTAIIFAVLEKREKAVVFAAGSGFLQDILSFGIYINAILKLLICALIGSVKQSFLGNEYSFVAGLVAIFTPLALMAESAIFFLFLGKQLDLSHLFTNIILGTVYNLMLVPIFLPFIRKLVHD